MSILVFGTSLFGIVTNKVPLLCFAVISSLTMSSVKVTVLSAAPSLIPETIIAASSSSMFFKMFSKHALMVTELLVASMEMSSFSIPAK